MIIFDGLFPNSSRFGDAFALFGGLLFCLPAVPRANDFVDPITFATEKAHAAIQGQLGHVFISIRAGGDELRPQHSAAVGAIGPQVFAAVAFGRNERLEIRAAGPFNGRTVGLIRFQKQAVRLLPGGSESLELRLGFQACRDACFGSCWQRGQCAGREDSAEDGAAIGCGGSSGRLLAGKTRDDRAIGAEIAEERNKYRLRRSVALVLSSEGGKVSGLRPQIDTGFQTHHRQVRRRKSDDLLRDFTHARDRGVCFVISAVALEEHAFGGPGGFKLGRKSADVLGGMRDCVRQNGDVCRLVTWGMRSSLNCACVTAMVTNEQYKVLVMVTRAHN